MYTNISLHFFASYSPIDIGKILPNAVTIANRKWKETEETVNCNSRQMLVRDISLMANANVHNTKYTFASFFTFQLNFIVFQSFYSRLHNYKNYLKAKKNKCKTIFSIIPPYLTDYYMDMDLFNFSTSSFTRNFLS